MIDLYENFFSMKRYNFFIFVVLGLLTWACGKDGESQNIGGLGSPDQNENAGINNYGEVKAYKI